MTPLLSVRGLKRYFSARKGLFGEAMPVKAVDGVSLDVFPQESFAVVGESGCGKTTLGRLILALDKPTIEKRRKRVLLTGDVPSPLSPPTGCHFHPRCRYAVEACKTQAPGLAQARPGHWAACPVLPFSNKRSEAALMEI